MIARPREMSETRSACVCELHVVCELPVVLELWEKSVQVVWEELKMIEVQECDVELKELPKR